MQKVKKNTNNLPFTCKFINFVLIMLFIIYLLCSRILLSNQKLMFEDLFKVIAEINLY